MGIELEYRMKGIQQALIAQYIGGLGMPNAAKGGEREVFLRNYLQALFPAHNRFSSGMIIDMAGSCTGQVDIAIEQPFSPSFPLPGDQSSRMLLAESVAAVIEVKSDVKAQWAQMSETIGKVRRLQRGFGVTMTIGSPRLSTIPCVAVGYKRFESPKTITTRLDRTDDLRRPDAVLCIESGAFVGPRITACGWYGIYALCAQLNEWMRGLMNATFDMYGYLTSAQE